MASNLVAKTRISDIQIRRGSNEVVVFTYGRGAYKATLRRPGSRIGSIEWHHKPLNGGTVESNPSLLQRWWFGIGPWNITGHASLSPSM